MKVLYLFVFPCLVNCLFTPNSSRSTPRNVESHIPSHIVRFGTASHESFAFHLVERLRRKDFVSSEVLVTQNYTRVFKGTVVKGLSLEEVVSIPGVLYAAPDSKKRIRIGEAWGLDRLDQTSLPLDGAYESSYSGLGVDVYIVDTGLDTTHVEFVGNSNRIVKNIYSSFQSSGVNLPLNTDGQGHGTHVAGTIGGKTVGVSPNCNLLGVQVLNESGEGDTSDILTALEFVHSRVQSNGNRPSVVSMSLGGPCETDDCSADSLVVAVESLVRQGIVVSVAAGNDGCDACSGSPNSAPNALTVGAIDDKDQAAYFSNFGRCVDVFAPGVDILSACSSLVCSNSKSYLSLSGTSMACPHVSGVVAQIMQKNPEFSPQQVADQIFCDGTVDQITFEIKDTVSRNLILHVPLATTAVCSPGLGCPNLCQSQGVCMPESHDAIRSDRICHCNNGYFGQSCAVQYDPLCSSAHNSAQLTLKDAFGDGWNYAKFSISNSSSGQVVDGAVGSLCSGDEGVFDFCFPNGCYDFQVSKGSFPAEIGWEFCTKHGGAPFSGRFCFHNNRCAQQCDYGVQQLILHDNGGDGWDGAYYAVYSELTKSHLFGGTLTDGSSDTHELCLPRSCSILFLEEYGSRPKEISFTICGYSAKYSSILKICLSDHNICTVSVLSANKSCLLNTVPVYMIDVNSNNWAFGGVNVSDSNGQLVQSGKMENSFAGVQELCLADGCYSFSAYSGEKNSDGMFWLACGRSGGLPWSAPLCVEKEYNLCYGLSGCPVLKSYSRTSDNNYIFISHSTSQYGNVLDAYKNSHGANEFCDLEDGCYDVVAGAGSYFGLDGRGQISLCDGSVLTMPASSRICVVNSTECTVESFTEFSCRSSTQVPTLIFKLDTFGDGWGIGVKYTIRKVGVTGIVASGSLSSGEYGYDSICLDIGACYTFTLPAQSYADEIIWLYCGFVGGAPARNLKFCVLSSGCRFDDDNDADVVDDDFPSAVTPIATNRPSPQPTATPSRLPSLGTLPPVWQTLHPSASPVLSLFLANFTVTFEASTTVSNQLTSADFLFVNFAVRRVLMLGSIDVWSINVFFVLPSGSSTIQSQSNTQLECIVQMGILKGSLKILKETISQSYQSGLFETLLHYCLESTAKNPNFPLSEIFDVQSINISYPSEGLYVGHDGTRPPDDGFSIVFPAESHQAREQKSDLSLFLIIFISLMLTLSIASIFVWAKLKIANRSPTEGVVIHSFAVVPTTSTQEVVEQGGNQNVQSYSNISLGPTILDRNSGYRIVSGDKDVNDDGL